MVRKIKLNGTWSEHPATLVEPGPDGWWLFSAAETMITNSDGRTGRQPTGGIQLVSFERWFRAWWFVPGEPPRSRLWERPWIAVDIAEPARIDEATGRIDVVDLELDHRRVVSNGGLLRGARARASRHARRSRYAR